MANIYGYNTSEYSSVNSGDIVLSDPRGFDFGMKPKDFARLMASAEISGGTLVGRYAYARSEDSSVILLNEKSPDFRRAVSARENFRKIKPVCVKKKELKIGHAYKAVKVLKGNWIYAGIYDTYSSECHMAAFDCGKYDIDSAIENEKDKTSLNYFINFKTSTGRMVFFPAEFNAKQPWISRTNISGIFEKETKCPQVFRFFDSPPVGVPPTVRSIENAIAFNPAFQRIDFARFRVENEWEQLDFEIFDSVLKYYRVQDKFMTFPFNGYYCYAIFKASRGFSGSDILKKYSDCWLKVTEDGFTYKTDMARSWRVINLSSALASKKAETYCSKSDLDVYKNITNEKFYSLINPVVPKLYFENGNKVPQHIAMMFVPADIRNVDEKCWA